MTCSTWGGFHLDRPDAGEAGNMERTLIYQFFHRKLRIIVLTILTYAALC